MRVLVTYYSETGNTEKVGRAIYEATQAEGHEAELEPVDQVRADRLSEYDLVFLGSACHSADLARPVKELLDRVPPSPALKLAGFVTHATVMPEGGEWQHEMHDRWASKCVLSLEGFATSKQVDLLGYFGCQGAPSPPVETFIHNTIVTDDAEWEAYLVEVRKHPTQEDLEEAAAFARDVLAKC
jgi:flavodoxin I